MLHSTIPFAKSMSIFAYCGSQDVRIAGDDAQEDLEHNGNFDRTIVLKKHDIDKPGRALALSKLLTHRVSGRMTCPLQQPY